MNKQELLDYINRKNIWYEITEHGEVFDMQEMSKIRMPYPEAVAKNLFVCDDKKTNYYLITIKGNRKVDLKSFWKKYNTRRLSFASNEDLLKILNLTAGSVTPLGLLNDTDLRVRFYLDEEFLGDKEIIGIHPNENTATLWMNVRDLIEIIEEHGNTVNILQTKMDIL